MVLTRQRADVSKLMYHVCFNGTSSTMVCWSAFDGQLRAYVSASLNGDLPDHSWWQATTGCHLGGARRWRSRSPLSSQPHHVLPLVSTMIDHSSPCPWRPEPVHHGQRMTRVPMQLARLVSTLPSSPWGSLTKPWLSVSSPGATSSGTPCRICPLLPSGTLGASLLTLATEMTSNPWPGNV